ncbi:MAG: hypothetical protein CVV24_03720 [Ignavibacteriae bacterium HGW-Ignavibacteriae-3]|nr:MAG: hypothetical protein CVV24_03720 [Ignavibacteriae bacterium HGW-Ignavibacteriae-3]
MKRSKLLIGILIIFLSASSIFAQTEPLKCNSQVQFHLVNGYSLSYLTMFSSSSGIRLKVDLGLFGSSSDSEHTQRYYNDPSVNSSTDVQKYKEDQSSNSQFINVTVNYHWLAELTKDLKLYLGAGPLIRLTRYSSENTQDRSATSYYSASKSNNKNTNSSFGLGVQGVVGIECSVTQKLSLLAEFNLDCTYSWDHRSYSSQSQPVVLSRTESTYDGNSWNYALNNLKIGIAYNF